MRALLAGLLLAAALAAPLPAGAAPADGQRPAEPSGVSFRSAHGLRVEAVRRTGPREWRLVVSTRALQRPVRVDLLLPRGYADSSRRYPSLYLFHGTGGGAHDWLEGGGAAAATRARPMVVVMPDAGYDGNGGSWFTDWVDQQTPLGAARWETFHVKQLIPWVDANLRTVRSRSGRAVAGLSQGGFGAFTYTARHPDRFGAAASFSGAPDVAEHPVARAGGAAVVGAIMTGLNQVQPYAPFGDPLLEPLAWRGHNPASLVTNLADTDLRLWTGNGTPGPDDDLGPATPPGVAIEAITYLSTLCFADAADRAGVRYALTDYGSGTHTWTHWARDLRDYLPDLARVFAERRPRPDRVSYRSVDARWSQWGWRVRTHRDPGLAWSGLRDASRRGFTLTGGAATVRTPAYFRPGARYRVTHSGGSGAGRVVADGRGRLTLDVVPSGGGPVAVTLSGRR